MVQINNTLNFVELGNAENPTLVFLHGLGGTLRYWNTGIEKLKSNHHLILIDLLGFGESPKPWFSYTKEKHLSAIHEILSEQESFILIGHSLGAALSLAYTEQYNDKVKGLILLSLPVFNNEKEAYIWMRRKPSGWLMTNMVITVVTCLITRYLARKIIPYFLTEYPKEVLEDLVKHNLLSSTTSLWNVLYNHSIYDKLELISPRITIDCVHSINDETAPINSVEQLVKTQKHWKLTKLDHSGHHPWLWDNTACLGVIDKVVQRLT